MQTTTEYKANKLH